MKTSAPTSSFGIQPISPQRIYQEVASQLRRNISEGKLRPGDKLPPERDLAQMFGVSRNTMREALRALELSGLIELKLGSAGGAFVLPGSSNAVVNGMRDLYFLGAITPEHLTAARISISSAVIRMACENMTDEDLAELERNVAMAEEMHKAGSFEERTKYHQAFHVLLAKATHNPILLATTEGIMEITRQFVKAIGPTEDQDYTLPSRKRLLNHLRKRDAEKAVKEMASALTKLQQGYMVKARGLPPGKPASTAPAASAEPARRPPRGPTPKKGRARAPGAA
ncbi:FadR/GntR family transcriptional regulator [Hydrogenophaga sp.]|uniref:FadR/GntR family transcriptional regulator n=1 Tax=Hydrogenophaga sp. TaxID=1904254 RepID=UPI002625C4D3|nr:FadR/GntR family transcriptional regulator [Hydrogenophaga sp.]MCW5653807.1 FadR family transcriptional regulator [Hydrogenophaga sp.]